MNENMEILTAFLVSVLIGLMMVVFTANIDYLLMATLLSFSLTFLALQTFEEDK
nr:MAG TPA: hypothetical protein [Caudoviricetes sp.]